MKIDLRRMLAGEVDRVDIDYTVALDGELPYDTDIDFVEFTTPMRVSGEIVNMGGYMRLRARVSVEYDTECSRCLAPLHRVFTQEFERTVVAASSLVNTSDEDADEEYLFIEEGMLDATPAAVEELLTNFPTKELCREDCRGLCPKCGKNLNEGECGCPKKEIDPRLAPLAKLLDESDS